MKADFERYKNALGFYSNTPGGSSGNDLLFTAEAVRIMWKAGLWTNEDHEALLQAIDQHATIERGLFGRPGWMQDQEAMDDYIGIGVIDPALAYETLEYGNAHFWIMRTSASAPWYETLFFRWPAMIAHLYYCTGRTPNALLRAAWCVSVAFSGSAKDQDPWLLNWLMVDIAGERGLPERLAASIWRKRLKRHWGSVRNVFAAYFGADHPCAKYCAD